MQVEYIYPLTGGEVLQVTFYKNNNLETRNSIIFVHGFKGFKEWGFFPYSANYFAERGYNVITFNFSHNGIENRPEEFTRLDKFEKNTVSREVYELDELISGIRNGFFGAELKETKIGLIGHSRGGAVSLALSNLMKNEISALALWASIAKWDRFTKRQIAEWKEQGYFEVINTRTNQIMRMGIDLLNDIEENQNGLLNIEKAVRNLNCPLFIAHGGQDITVPPDEADLLYEWSDKENTELYILPTAGHTFDVQHPFIGTNDKLERLLENSAKFFRKHFNN